MLPTPPRITARPAPGIVETLVHDALQVSTGLRCQADVYQGASATELRSFAGQLDAALAKFRAALRALNVVVDLEAAPRPAEAVASDEDEEIAGAA